MDHSGSYGTLYGADPLEVTPMFLIDNINDKQDTARRETAFLRLSHHPRTGPRSGGGGGSDIGQRRQPEVPLIPQRTPLAADRRVRPQADDGARQAGATCGIRDSIDHEEAGGQDFATRFGGAIWQSQERTAFSRCGHVNP